MACGCSKKSAPVSNKGITKQPQKRTTSSYKKPTRRIIRRVK